VDLREVDRGKTIEEKPGHLVAKKTPPTGLDGGVIWVIWQSFSGDEDPEKGHNILSGSWEYREADVVKKKLPQPKGPRSFQGASGQLFHRGMIQIRKKI